MTTISAEVILDSITDEGVRITTFQLRYPRWIHAEGRTHRQLRIGEDEFDVADLINFEARTPSLMEDPALSRNASSSRAVPVHKLIEDVIRDPAIPMFWGSNQRGMQAGAECNELVYLLSPDLEGFNRKVDAGTSWDFNYYDKDGTLISKSDSPDEEEPHDLWPYEMGREEAWMEAMYRAIDVARAFDRAGYHKQIVNRLLEPFSHINVVVTATEWSNFYGLRRHKDAEPHIHLLADRMWEAQQASKPRHLEASQWHLPYVTEEELDKYGLQGGKNLSVARCASVSYTTVDGEVMTPERALALHDKLVGMQPVHASPAEHQAAPDYRDGEGRWIMPKYHGNLVGMIQYRKTLPNECIL